MTDASATPWEASRPDLAVGVVGTGAMGRGIMQVAALGGLSVIAYDAKAGAADAAVAYVAQMIGRLVDKGTVTKAAADAAVARLAVAARLEDLAGCHLVVEAAAERLDVKRTIFAELDRLTPPSTILASNTSSLPITAIAAATARPERVAGLHFFNPVPLMKLVEVVPGLRTAPWVTAALVTIARRMTREPIVCADSPGFVVNHIGRAYVPEAARIQSEGIATHAEIDAIMTGAPGFRMGPFALLDLIGADVSVSVMESLWSQFYAEPMYATQPALRLRVDGGLYGQKTAAGWYGYEGGKRQEVALPVTPQARPRSVWIGGDDAGAGALAALLQAAGVARADEPETADVHMLALVGPCLAEALDATPADPARTVAVDMLFGPAGPRTLMISPATDPAVRDKAHGALGADGTPVVVVNDSPGFVAQRIVAHIVNVGCQIAQRAIATPADIDTGARLGLSYPLGPLAFGDRLGARRVLAILESLERFYREPRYRPSPWLKRRALLDLPLTSPERRA
ncbi:MAG: 3-hydroxyacyl-CoA dehydrogenase [Hyphomicrobiaceae bacterium]